MAPSPAAPVLVVGCGNPLRGDDGAGPYCVRLLTERGVPGGVELLDGGTTALDVALAMRGRRTVIVIDGACTGAEPGTVHRVSGESLTRVPPVEIVGLHTFRWDHALAASRWLPGIAGEPGPLRPPVISVLLVEVASTALGAGLSPVVAKACERVVVSVLADLRGDRAASGGDDQW